MSDAPERIWAYGNGATGQWKCWEVRHPENAAEYIRADVAGQEVIDSMAQAVDDYAKMQERIVTLEALIRKFIMTVSALVGALVTIVAIVP